MSDAPPFCLSRKTAIPPGGFRCVVPETDVRVSASDWPELVKACEKVLSERGIVPPPDFIRKIENAVCQQLPGYSFCKPCHQVQQKLGFNEIVRWVKAMYGFATKHGFSLVSQDEADRRAKICAACPHQIPTSGCWGCKGIAGLLPQIAGARSTPYDAQLKACGVCGCYNAVSVHLPVDAQQDAHLTFPDHCWKRS